MQTFTLEEAAALIANKYGWHERAHATLVEQLLEAARAGTLTVRHPHTDIQYRPEQHRAFYETVGVADLNSYFEGDGVQWRLESYGETADPLFDTEWWNLHQVLAWVYLGDRALVKVGAIVNQDAHVQLKLKAAERQGVCYPSVCAAEKAIAEALQTGKLTAYGLRNGGGDLTGIPSAQWADLKFWWDPDHAGPSDCFRPMENCWVTLRFQRKDVLAIWPDPLDQPRDRSSAEEHPAGPAAVGAVNPFAAMGGLTWTEITITFTEPGAVRVKARGKSETFTYDAMGFRHRSSQRAKPIKCWETFRFLAILSRSTSGKTWRDVIPEREIHNLKKRISLLRDKLKRFFRINDDPIVYRGGDEYEAVFILTPVEPFQDARARHTGHTREPNTDHADDEYQDEDIEEEMQKPPGEG